MASKTTPTWFRPEVAEYVAARATQPDAVLSQLIERTRAETGGAAGMQVSASQGALLTLLARVGGARRGLEIAYAEQAGVRWFILSAQHGLVSPDEVLEPYELRLSKTSREYRREWGQRVVNQLADAIGPIEGRTIEVHAGSAYIDAIRDGLRVAGAEVVEPLEGLALGPRLAWYGDGPAAPAAPTPPPEVDELIEHLTDKAEAISPADFLATGARRFRSPGLYSWRPLRHCCRGRCTRNFSTS